MMQRSIARSTFALVVKLAAQGIAINQQVDLAGVRRKLQPYYARWKETFGAPA